MSDKKGPTRHRARKRFGQNFLVDPQIIAHIVAAISPRPEDNLIEIGPGQGAMTGPVLERCPSLQVIELDRDLVPLLREKFAQYPGLLIDQGDALKTDFSRFYEPDRPLRIIGNLPYNISTPLLFHLLSFSAIIRDMHFMLQREVVDRLAATPGDKLYGRLSVMVQYHSRVEPLFRVPAGAFRPAPKVESAIVRLQPYGEPPSPANDLDHMAKLVNACFQQRRKTIRNTLKHLVDESQLTQLNIDLSLRPEKLSVADFVRLSNQLQEMA